MPGNVSPLTLKISCRASNTTGVLREGVLRRFFDISAGGWGPDAGNNRPDKSVHPLPEENMLIIASEGTWYSSLAYNAMNFLAFRSFSSAWCLVSGARCLMPDA